MLIFIKDKWANKNLEMAHLGCSLPTPDVDCAFRVCMYITSNDHMLYLYYFYYLYYLYRVHLTVPVRTGTRQLQILLTI